MNNAKAGAGLPYFENRVIKYILIPLSRVVLDWNSALKLLQKEQYKVNELIKDLSAQQRCKQVSIPRVFGIEEHSSDYSVNLVLEHISIVTQAMIFVIDTLSKEQSIEKEIRIEAIKPTKNNENEAEHFNKTLNAYIEYIKTHDKKVSTMTKEHPWFVKFNNKDWATFTYIHAMVHRRQIEAIIKHLN